MMQIILFRKNAWETVHLASLNDKEMNHPFQRDKQYTLHSAYWVVCTHCSKNEILRHIGEPFFLFQAARPNKLKVYNLT